MKILKAFKYRLKTNPATERSLRKACGCRRLVWNRALALQKERLDHNFGLLPYADICRELTTWKHDLPFLYETHSQVLQQTLKDLARAFEDAFDPKQPNKQFPVFHKRGRSEGLRYPQGVKVDEADSRFFLPKAGWVRYRNSRRLEGTLKQCHITSRNGKWYVSFQCEIEAAVEAHPSPDSAVGIDLGVKHFAVFDNGTIKRPVNSLCKKLKRLARLQKDLARKQKGSGRWCRQKRKISRLHEKIGNIRKDFLQKLSTDTAKNHGLVVIEDLKVKSMSRSASGTEKKPGKGVKRKSRLNRSILDQGWYEFRRMLGYKLFWNGGSLLTVDPANTSRTCPVCRHVSKGNRPTRDRFKCLSCGFEGDADHIAAVNILAAGQAVIQKGRGEGQRPSVKRQPSVSGASHEAA